MIFRINRMYKLNINSLRNILLNQPKVYFCSSESEEQFFSLQPNKLNETKKKGYVPIRKILATTNKNDFGPLLETTKEKRQRLKYEALGKEIPKKSKKRQMERRMKDETYESLLDKPENSLFDGNQTTRQNIKFPESIKKEKAKKSQMERSMEDETYELLLDKPENYPFNGNQTIQQNIKFPDSIKKENFDMNRKILKKVPGKVVVGNFNYTPKSKTQLRKLIIVPQESYYKPIINQSKVAIQKKDDFSNPIINQSKVAIQNKDDFSIETQRRNRIVIANGSDNLSQHANRFIGKNVNEKDHSQNYDNELSRDSTEDGKYKETQEFFRYSNASQITIDNSKWTAAPRTINMNELSKTPLVPEKYSIQQNDNNFVKTIGIFEGGYQKLPSVTKILDATMPLSSRIALDKWKAKMVAELGEQEFAAYQKDMLDTGKAFHSCIEATLHDQEPVTEELERCSGYWHSIEAVLPGVSNAVALESRVLHPHLHYQGMLDCVAYYRDNPVLIEWKTSRKPKTTIKSMYDNPLQVAAYIGALNYDSNYTLSQPINSGLLVAAYESGAPADVHLLKPQECQHFWTLWLKRLAQFWQKQKLIFPGAQ